MKLNPKPCLLALLPTIFLVNSAYAKITKDIKPSSPSTRTERGRYDDVNGTFYSDQRYRNDVNPNMGFSASLTPMGYRSRGGYLGASKDQDEVFSTRSAIANAYKIFTSSEGNVFERLANSAWGAVIKPWGKSMVTTYAGTKFGVLSLDRLLASVNQSPPGTPGVNRLFLLPKKCRVPGYTSSSNQAYDFSFLRNLK